MAASCTVSGSVAKFFQDLKFPANSADTPACDDSARREDFAGDSLPAALALLAPAPGALNMTFGTEQRRLTMLGLAAVLSGLVGCSMFKEKATPKLSAEVTPGVAPNGPQAAKYVVEIRSEKGKPQAVEKPLAEAIHVQTALEQTGAIKKFDRAFVEIYRPLPSGGWHKMKLEYDRETHRIPPEYDYAVLPGDRIIVTEDTSTVMDDFMERALKPLGINPPKKPDPLKERYQIQG